MQKQLETGDQQSSGVAETPAAKAPPTAAMPVLIALSFAHLLNDMMQSLVPAIYPILKDVHGLTFGQIGIITFTFQLTASLFQPAIGHITDKKPQPFSLVAGMGFTLIGLIILGYASNYMALLAGAALVGTGSAIFHPEATRVARMASGGRQGFAQAIFQLGGQGGGAIGPVLAAFIVVPYGQASVAWFAAAAVFAMMVLGYVGQWYAGRVPAMLAARAKPKPAGDPQARTSAGVLFAVFILIVLMFSKSAYTASFTSYYTFFLIDKFDVSIKTAQLMLFLYLGAGAIGVLVGGPLGDRIGRRAIIWFSILGALPFSMILPYADFFWTAVLTVLVAFIMSSAFAAILVFAMELLPGRVGLIGGLFYGLVFGLGAVSAAIFGEIADRTSIAAVFQICALLPIIGLLTWFLPDIRDSEIE